MSLPVRPDPATILRSCIHTLDHVLLPEVESPWGRYSGDLLRAALEYAIGLLGEDRGVRHRSELAAALDALRPLIAETANPTLSAALDEPSPFEAASRLLVAGQQQPGPTSDRVREALRPLLLRQLDEEFAAAVPMLAAFAKNMQAAQ